jgi:hypothetical protein
MVYPILRCLLDSHPCPDEEMIAEEPANADLAGGGGFSAECAWLTNPLCAKLT